MLGVPFWTYFRRSDVFEVSGIVHYGKANFQFCFGGPRGCNKDVKNITFEISNLGYVYPENPTLISRLSMQKDGVEMHAKQRDGGQCYTYL